MYFFSEVICCSTHLHKYAGERPRGMLHVFGSFLGRFSGGCSRAKKENVFGLSPFACVPPAALERRPPGGLVSSAYGFRLSSSLRKYHPESSGGNPPFLGDAAVPSGTAALRREGGECERCWSLSLVLLCLFWGVRSVRLDFGGIARCCSV